MKAAGLHAQGKSEGAQSSAAAAGPHLTAGRTLVPLLDDSSGGAACGGVRDPSLLKKLMHAPKLEAALLTLADGLRAFDWAGAAGNGIAGNAPVSDAEGISS